MFAGNSIAEIEQAIANLQTANDLWHGIHTVARCSTGNDLERVSYHEAGHAVAQILLHPNHPRGVVNVTIIPGTLADGRRYNGCCSGVEPPKASDHQKLVVFYAGPLASQMAGKCKSKDPFDTFWNEHGDAEEMLERRVGAMEQGDAHNAAHDLLDKNWGAVKAVAFALLDRKTLSGDDVKEIVGAYLDRMYGHRMYAPC